MYMKLSDETADVLKRAKILAKELNHRYAGSEHVLVSLLSCSDTVRDILNIAGINSGNAYKMALSVLRDTRMSKITTDKVNRVTLSPRATKVIGHAAAYSQQLQYDKIQPGAVLLSILNDLSGMCSYLFSQLDIDVDELRANISGVLGIGFDEHNTRTIIETNGITEDTTSRSQSSGSSGSGASPIPTGHTSEDEQTALEKFTTDLTLMAAHGQLAPVIGRETQIDRMIEVLTRKKKNNPLLIGEPGVGKTSVVEGLASKIVSGSVPDNMLNKKILQLDINAMVAGTVYRGQFEERLKGLITELKDSPEVLLFIDEMHTVMGAGTTGGGSLDFSNVIKPELAKGEISCIGVTTTDKYIEMIETEGAFNRRFQKITIEEPTIEDMHVILKRVKTGYEKHHRVKFTQKTIDCIINKCYRYMPDKRFPDKAIDVIDELGAGLRYKTFREYFFLNPEVEAQLDELERAKKLAKTEQQIEQIQHDEEALNQQLDESVDRWMKLEKKNINVTEQQCNEYFSKVTGVPVENLAEDETHRLIHMEQELNKQIIGQSEAVGKIAQAIKRGRLALHDPNKPVAVFLFLGQTGVGKTYIAKVLNELLFGTSDSIIHINMSEMMEAHSVSKLIGSPPGYVGHDRVDSESFANKVRANPYSVVLFDEIEKADPAVLQVLLQVFEEGKLRDSRDREIDFTNCYIIMTSNIGSALLQKSHTVGFGRIHDDKVETEHKIKKELTKTMAPELINRIDNIVIFNNLERDQLQSICELEVKHVKRMLRQQLGVKLTYDKTIHAQIIEDCYEEGYGARPIKRYLRGPVINELSDLYLQNTETRHIHISVQHGRLHYESVV
jgi:ATP-dependent Clp protease ATP-binding subunit ClpC